MKYEVTGGQPRGIAAKINIVISVFQIGVLVQVLVSLLLIYLLVNVFGKAIRDGLSTWSPSFDVGNPDGVPGQEL